MSRPVVASQCNPAEGMFRASIVSKPVGSPSKKRGRNRTFKTAIAIAIECPILLQPVERDKKIGLGSAYRV
jgi:hypothetical protein